MTELAPQTAETPAGPAVGSAEVPTLRIHATPRTLIVRAVVAAILATLAILGRRYHLTVFPWCLAAYAACGFLGVARAAAFSLRVSPAGLRTRGRLIPWTDVFQIIVQENPLARSVRLDVFVKGNRRLLRLSVPRSSRLFPDPAFDRDVARLQEWCAMSSGFAAVPKNSGRFRRSWTIAAVALLTLVLVAPDRPWGWIGGAEASVVPSACALAATLPSALKLGPPAPLPSTTTKSACVWSVVGAPQFAGGPVFLAFELHRRYGLHSGSDLAGHQSVSDLDTLVGGTPLVAPGVGAETGAGREFGVHGHLIATGTALMDVDVRGNVEVLIVLHGSADAATFTMLAAIEKTAVAAITLR